jgi:hypothetical protein
MARRVLVAAAVVLATVVTGCTIGADSSPSTSSTPVPSAESTVTTVTPSTTSTTRLPTTTSTTTTTLAGPPVLEVLDPAHGATVTTSRYTFTGVTDPGCSVDVGGKYFADVDVDGNWTLDLMLQPGGNTTTITATDGDGAKSAVQVALTYAPIVLSADGLGIVSFGDPVDDAMAILTGQLGTPSSDEFPYPGESIFPGTYWRVIRWDTPNLEVHFMDWRPFEVLDTPILGYWGTGMGTPTLATVEHIGPGTPWVDVAAAYGDRVVAAEPDDDVCRHSWGFSIDRDAATDYFFHMRGDLDGDPADPATAIRTIYAGVAMEGC